jgi:hypothetical protein
MYEYFADKFYCALRRCQTCYSDLDEWNAKTRPMQLVKRHQYGRTFRMLTVFNCLFTFFKSIIGQLRLTVNCRIKKQTPDLLTMYESFNDVLSKALRRCKKCYSVPYEWNEKTSRFQLIQNQGYCKTYRSVSSFDCSYTLITILSSLLVIRFETSQMLIILSTGITTGACMMGGIRFMHSTFQDIVPFLNAVITFQRVNVHIGKTEINAIHLFIMIVSSLAFKHNRLLNYRTNVSPFQETSWLDDTVCGV